MREPIRSIAVVGDGITGLSAAAAFRRALPQVAVTVVKTQPDPAALVDRAPYSTPMIARFHAAIGLEEAAVLRAGAATPLLGFRFEDWPKGGEPWVHVHASHGMPVETAPMFHRFWARARRAGEALPYHRYSAAGPMAEAGKFVHPQPDPSSPLGSFDYALRLEPDAYRDLLASHATQMGVQIEPAILSKVESGVEGISALRLESGIRIRADLFLDCAGPSLALARGDFERWPLPLDHVRISAPPPAASSREAIAATDDGWHSDRITVGREDGVQIRTGRLAAPWRGNVLALGDAAVAVDPLHGLGLHLTHTGILRALQLLPGRDFHSLELREYNRRAAEEASRVRDFIVLHYRRWGAEITPGLAHTLEQFEKRGRLPLHDEDTIAQESWLAALIGLGHVPRHTDPIAASADPAAVAEGLAHRATALAEIATQLPPYAEYLARYR